MKRLIILILAAASLLMAQPPRRGGEPEDLRGEDRHVMPTDRLNLSEQQRTQIETLRSDAQKDLIRIRSEIATMRVDLRELLRKNPPDQKAVEGKMSEIGKLKNQAMLKGTGLWFGIHNLLTPEQQEIWRERPPGMGPLMGERGGKKLNMHRHCRGRDIDGYWDTMRHHNW